MSALLDQLCGRERLQECASHEPQRCFVVTIGDRKAPRIRQEVYAISADQVYAQFQDMRQTDGNGLIEAIRVRHWPPSSLCPDCDTAATCSTDGCVPKLQLTEEQLLAFDLAYHRAKVGGQLQRERDERALDLQIQHQSRTGEICR